MDDILKEFIIESLEGLDRIERHLVTMEKTPDASGLLNEVFRAVHTVKGASGFLGLGRLEKVTHAGEDLLSKLRAGTLKFSPEIATGLLGLVDAVRKVLAGLEKTGTEPELDFSPLIAELGRLQGALTAAATTPVAKPAVPSTPAPVKDAVPATPKVDPAPAAPPPQAPVPAPPTAAAEAAAAPPPEIPPTTSTAADSKVRVDVALLDKLMNLVGELVLARNQIVQLNADREEAVLGVASQRLDLITTELQEEIMKTRLQPIGFVWAKFPRVVRDLSREMGKPVRLEMTGEGTELDRTIIEAIKDPLTHIVRNSIDHGIESPAQRKAAGKIETGLLSLHAYHEGGHVNIEIRDDGKGIDAERVKTKAVERGTITAEQAARMDEREALHLIFQPGLSTAEKITNLSGRGVGMDVVKTNIEKVGGSVDLQSQAGRGTTVKIKIPLTLAIIPALMVISGQERYAIPQVSLVELVRLDGSEARTAIEDVMGAPVYRLRGHLLPIVYLGKVLRQPATAAAEDQPVNIVVLQADDIQFGLVVDGISDTQEIVVKPLGKHFKNVPVFAGATILGDGQVALILDVLGLAQHTRVHTRARERQMSHEVDAAINATQARKRLLVVGLGEARRCAIDLATVGRLEQIPRTLIERSGGREVVQYRGQIMDLLRLTDCLGEAPGVNDAGEVLSVVVYSAHGRSIGLVVGQIVDIVEDNVEVKAKGGSAGSSGTAVIHGRVTELLDLSKITSSFATG